MSPLQQQKSMKKQSLVATSAGGHTSGTIEARILGSAIAGIAELALFHPVDTVAKRLMTSESQLIAVGSISSTAHNLNHAIFRDAAQAGVSSKAASLFPGIGFGAAYKVLQRVYKFGGQPALREWLNKKHGQQMRDEFGPKMGKTLTSAVAGSIIGIGEVALLPLDMLKVKAQTSPECLKGRGVIDIVLKEKFKLYRGWGWTMARNAPGSFALFGGNAFAKSWMGLDEKEQATWAQDATASCAGAVASISVAAPLDVVKTRIQNRPFNSPESGMSIIANLIKTEGPMAFFKGLTPKLLVVGPKLVFSFTIAQHTIAYFTRVLDK